MSKIRITAVSYLNTKPLLYGLFKSKLSGKIDLQLDIPSDCALKLKNGEADLGLVPVAIIPEIEHAQIISDYCIGSVGSVKTVAIFAEQPIEKLTHIFLDFHSRTSVELTKILFQKYWHLSPTFIPATEGYEKEIKGSTGGLIIGDRTIGLEQQFPFSYDLGAAWTAYTNLPFVYAAWVSRKRLSSDFIIEFNEALKAGVEAIPELIYLLPKPSSGFDLKKYYTHYISYELDAEKRQALQLFLSLLPAKKQHEVQAVP